MTLAGESLQIHCIRKACSNVRPVPRPIGVFRHWGSGQICHHRRIDRRWRVCAGQLRGVGMEGWSEFFVASAGTARADLLGSLDRSRPADCHSGGALACVGCPGTLDRGPGDLAPAAGVPACVHRHDRGSLASSRRNRPLSVVSSQGEGRLGAHDSAQDEPELSHPYRLLSRCRILRRDQCQAGRPVESLAQMRGCFGEDHFHRRIDMDLLQMPGNGRIVPPSQHNVGM